MNSIKYQNHIIPIYTNEKYDFLISNKDLADICMVFERLVDQTLYLNNESVLIEGKHYIEINEKRYWTKTGIVRICILLQNEEALDFGEFIEEFIY